MFAKIDDAPVKKAASFGLIVKKFGVVILHFVEAMQDGRDASENLEYKDD